MAIYDILSEVQDAREGNAGICEFNGFLEDYLSTIETVEEKEEVYTLLSKLFEKDCNLKICVGLRLNINKDAIANQIIRYKDAFKLPKGSIVCPYVVYGKFDDVQKAIILTLGDKEEYVKAKALYYVMSEPENEYEGTRNEIIADCMNEENVELMLQAVESFFFQNSKAGIVQRNLDSKMFDSYTEMYELANQMGKEQEASLRETLAASENKEACINSFIANWFLLKKFSYVQYMMDKNNLNAVHEGNVKRQRQVAKEKSDAIGFVSFSELWKLAKEVR